MRWVFAWVGWLTWQYRSPVWNYTLLAASGVDRVQVMSTYAANVTEFYEQLALAVAAIPLPLLGIGLETDINVTLADYQSRMATLTALNVREVAFWQSPIPLAWLPALRTFVRTPTQEEAQRRV